MKTSRSPKESGLRCDQKIQRDAAARGIGQAFVLFAVTLGLVVVFGGIVQLWSLSRLKSVGVGLAITELVLILLPAVLFFRWKGVPFKEAVRLRSISLPIAALSVGLGFGGWSIAETFHNWLTPFFGSPSNEWLKVDSQVSLLFMLVCGAVLPAICEETMFRGAIQGILRRRGTTWSIVVTGLLFGVFHLHPSTILPAATIGVVLGVLVERTNSILPAILMHAANNTTALFMGYLFRDSPNHSMTGAMLVMAVVFLLSLFAVLRLTAHREHAQSPLEVIPASLALRRATIWKFGTLSATVPAALLVGLLQFFGSYTMASDHLTPYASKGDLVIVLHQRWIRTDIQPNDVISFRRESKTLLRRVIRCDESAVVVDDNGIERRVPRADIVDKLIHVVHISDLRNSDHRK